MQKPKEQELICSQESSETEKRNACNTSSKKKRKDEKGKRMMNYTSSSKIQSVYIKSANHCGLETTNITPLVDNLKAKLFESESSLYPKSKDVGILGRTEAPLTHGIPEQTIIPINEKKEKVTSNDKRVSSPIIRKLKLEVIEKGRIPKGVIIHIDSNGLVGSKRNAKDGITYFGSEAPGADYQLNDYVIVDKENALGQRYFRIIYDRKDNKYLLNDMEDGSGTYIKITNKHILCPLNTIAFGDSSFTVHTTYEKILTLKFRTGPKTGKV